MLSLRKKTLQLLCGFLAFCGLFTLCCALFGTVRQGSARYASIVAEAAADVKEEVGNSPRQILLLDAGHGGMDAGAVVGELREKDLNLALTLRLADLLRQAGYTVILTREDDRMLGDGEKGSAKLSDLRERLSLTEQYPTAWLISIHMNKFPLESCRGLTVYYGNAPESRQLGESVRKMAVETLQPENTREMKQATSAIYLLHRAKIPAVLVECGFLSNPEEAALLTDPDYQAKLAAVIAAGICAYGEA